MKSEKGLSLLEVLIVITIFAVIGILITRSIVLTLGGTKKGESIIKVRENLDYAMGVIERQIRNANSIPVCTNSSATTLNYIDQNGGAGSFSCMNIGGADSFVASGSARLTNNSIQITNCSFTCTQGTGANPPSVSVNLEAQESGNSGTQNSKVSTTTQIFLRTY